MLFPDEHNRLLHLLAQGNEQATDAHVAAIRLRMNSHPAGQTIYNVLTMDGVPVRGLQHIQGDRTVLSERGPNLPRPSHFFLRKRFARTRSFRPRARRREPSPSCPDARTTSVDIHGKTGEKFK